MPPHNEQITADLTINLDEMFFEGPAAWDFEGESYRAEAYSHGGSRGTEVSAGVELVSVKIGGLTLNRTQIALMIGEDDLRKQEADIAASLSQDMPEAA